MKYVFMFLTALLICGTIAMVGGDTHEVQHAGELMIVAALAVPVLRFWWFIITGE